MAENIPDIPVENVVNGILNTSSNPTVHNKVDLKCVNKIEIVYTRSRRDYFRNFIFSCGRIVLIGLVIYLLLFYFFNNVKQSISSSKQSIP